MGGGGGDRVSSSSKTQTIHIPPCCQVASGDRPFVLCSFRYRPSHNRQTLGPQNQTLKRKVHDDKKRQSTLFTRSVRRLPPPGHLPTHVYPGAPYYCELPATRHPFGYKKTGGGGRPPAISPGGRETKTAICCGTSPRRKIDGRFSLPSAPMIKHVWENEGPLGE